MSVETMPPSLCAAPQLYCTCVTPMLSPPRWNRRFVSAIYYSFFNGLSEIGVSEAPESRQGTPLASDDSQIGGLAGRYATAAFELALEERALDSLSADLAQLKALMGASPELKRLIRSPAFSRDDQAAGMEAVLKQANATPLAVKLVLLLTRKRRLFILSDVIRAFEALLARHRGEIAASATSARALTHEETEELKRVLKENLGREPKLELSVDQSLLGGLVLRVGSRMIDSSLRRKLNGLRAAMRGN
jgi:F-type H+-transporting ATPase subunit delta